MEERDEWHWGEVMRWQLLGFHKIERTRIVFDDAKGEGGTFLGTG